MDSVIEVVANLLRIRGDDFRGMQMGISPIQYILGLAV